MAISFKPVVLAHKIGTVTFHDGTVLPKHHIPDKAAGPLTDGFIGTEKTGIPDFDFGGFLRPYISNWKQAYSKNNKKYLFEIHHCNTCNTFKFSQIEYFVVIP